MQKKKKRPPGRPPGSKKPKTKAVDEIRSAPPVRKSPIAYDIADSPKVVSVQRDSPRHSPIPEFHSGTNDHDGDSKSVPNSQSLKQFIGWRESPPWYEMNFSSKMQKFGKES